MILFLFIIILEDVGYMARAAFLLDKIMGGAGLHTAGRSFPCCPVSPAPARGSWRRG